MTDDLIIVTGLPRSGTSMMMRMIEAGGVPALTDKVRTADEDNPAGYYEYEPVKRTADDPSWVPAARGKVVKMVYQLIYDMPSDHSYKLVLMRRKMEEVLASQQAMLARSGEGSADISDDMLADLFHKTLAQFESWVADQKNLEMISINYNDVQQEPSNQMQRLSQFLDRSLDVEAMAAVVDPSLYRNRG